MDMYVYSIYDSKAEAFITPWFAQTPAVAMRQFIAAANDKGDFNRFAEDYTLFELGKWDTETALFESHKTPISKGNAIQFRTEKPPKVSEAKRTLKHRSRDESEKTKEAVVNAIGQIGQ